MKMFLALSMLLVTSMPAQSADDYRGGWRTDSGDPHIYLFSIRGDQVRGSYCSVLFESQREFPRIKSTISVLPIFIAKVRGLSPSSRTLFGSAPCARSQPTVSPAIAGSCNNTHMCRNVRPSVSHTIFTSIPFSIASSASSMATVRKSGSARYGGAVISPSFRSIRSPR